jgi:hypothetical protein
MNESHDLPLVDDALNLFTSEGPESESERVLSAETLSVTPSELASFAPEESSPSIDSADATAWSAPARQWEWRRPWLLVPLAAVAMATGAVFRQFVPDSDSLPTAAQTAYAAPSLPGSTVSTVSAERPPDIGVAETTEPDIARTTQQDVVGTTQRDVAGTTQQGVVGTTQRDVVGTAKRDIVGTTQPSETRGPAKPREAGPSKPREAGPSWLPPISPPAPRRPDPIPPPSQPPSRFDAPAVTSTSAVAAVPDPPPTTVKTEPPLVAVAAESAREAPRETSPLPEPAPARPAIAPARPATAPGIRVALDEYENAVGRLDMKAVRAVWPSADVKGLAKAFDQLREQSLKLEDCRIAPAGSTAVATCAGTLRYVPKMGNKTERVERRQWEFSLREKNESWVIERVASR